MEGINKISSGGVVYAVEDEENREEVEKLKNPEFSDTGNVAGIASFPDFLAKVKSKMDIFGFFRDFKAGMQFVLHAGQIVNNCVSDRADLPLAAKQGKLLAEEDAVLKNMIAKLNSDLGRRIDVYGSLLDFALSCEQGISVFCTGSITTDTPFAYCVGEVFVRGDDFKIVAYNLQSGEVATNRKTNNMPTWEGWSNLVINTDLGKTKFIEFGDGSYFNDPLGLLKNKWENLDVNSTYLVRLVCGNTYLATVLKWSEHTYGSAFIIGYGLSEPIYANLNKGVWSEKVLATK